MLWFEPGTSRLGNALASDGARRTPMVWSAFICPIVRKAGQWAIVRRSAPRSYGPHQRRFAGWSIEAKLKNPRISALCDGVLRPGRGAAYGTKHPSRHQWANDPTGLFASKGVLPLCRVINRGHWADVRTVKIWSLRIRGPPCHVRYLWSIAATYTGARFAPDGARPRRRAAPGCAFNL